jgi:ABC-type transport system involved in multi-copper enzyme maturation permease subunit
MLDLNLENIRWEFKKLLIFPIPEIVIVSMIFNGTLVLPSIIVLSEGVYVYSFVKNILHSIILYTFMVQGVTIGVMAATIFAYEREAGILDTELVYSRSRTELFVGKFTALFLVGIIYFFTVVLMLIVYNLRGSWLIESVSSLISLCLPMLVQIIFIISLNIFISTISDKIVISILSSALTFYSLDNLLKYSNPQPGSFLYNIPPISTSAFLHVPTEAAGNLIVAFIISLCFLLVAYLYFTRFYEVK